jgi:hypothetical protein
VLALYDAWRSYWRAWQKRPGPFAEGKRNMLRSAASTVMWVGRSTVLLVGLAVILAMVLGVATAALAGTGVGATFNLGRLNTVN